MRQQDEWREQQQAERKLHQQADRKAASQRSELAQLRRDNERLRKVHLQPAPSRRAKALSALTALNTAALSPTKLDKGELILPPLTPPLRLGRQMGAAIAAELRAMAIEARALIRSLCKAPDAAMDAPPDGSTVSGNAQVRIEALKSKYQQRFDELADIWSKRMIGDVMAQSTAQLMLGLKDLGDRMAIQATMATPRMRAIVQAASQASTQLITRIPEQFLGKVQVRVMSAITTGSGLSDLVPYLTKLYEGDARHAHLTALDQIRKVSENVNSTRLQSLGVEEYDWIHTGGERYPRKLHQRYNGKRFRFDDPPIIDEKTGVRGSTGDAIGCRCRKRAVLNFSKMREVA